MKMKILVAAGLAIAAAAAPTTIDASRVGAQAPEFRGTDTKGTVHNLSDFKGKWVVLEWHNEGCPYVRKHYGGNNMQQLQKEWTAKGVVWLTVISSAAGKQGYVTAPEANAYAKDKGATPTAILLDPSGEVGHAYDAKTSPHMFIVDPNGVLIYNGAIDDKPTADLADLAGAKNYVSQALGETLAGKPVSEPTTRPYGCSVKYAGM